MGGLSQFGRLKQNSPNKAKSIPLDPLKVKEPAIYACFAKFYCSKSAVGQ